MKSIFPRGKVFFSVVAKTFEEQEGNLEYLVDSMPVCMNLRSYRCKLLSHKEFIGFCKAEKKFYYKFKLLMITTSKGHPVEFIITPASVADVTVLQIMEISLPFGSTQHSGCVRYLQSILRKRIETTFKIVVRLFFRKIHALTKAGFFVEISCVCCFVFPKSVLLTSS